MTRRLFLWFGLVLLSSAGNARGQSLTFTPLAPPPNLVVNPGFETWNFNGWTRSGNTNFMFVTGAFDGIAPHGGSYQAVIGTKTGTGTLSQVLATQAGKTYDISFWLANYGMTANSFNAKFGNNTLVSLTNEDAQPYTEYTYAVKATAITTTLQFNFQQVPAYWYLDDVDVSLQPMKTPPPPTLLTTLAGGAMLGLRLLRSRRRCAA